MLTEKYDISKYLEVNINNDSDGTFKPSKSHLLQKITNHIGLTVSSSLEYKETQWGKTLLYKDEYSIL